MPANFGNSDSVKTSTFTAGEYEYIGHVEPHDNSDYLALLAYNKADLGLSLIASVNAWTASSSFPARQHLACRTCFQPKRTAITSYNVYVVSVIDTYGWTPQQYWSSEKYLFT